MTELLTGALLADGTGHPLRPADVIIDNGRITAVEPPGTLPEHHPRRDLTGLVLAPGFIDVHSHADNAPLLTEDDTTKILQGVTTEVVGNCGFSLAPRSTTHAEVHDGFLQRLFPPLDVTWNRFAELLDATDAAGHVTNHCPLIGHGTLRVAATGMSDAAPDAAALHRMREMLDEAMSAGAFGLSTGLIYPPALFAGIDELTALARTLGGHGLYATHMRDEGDHLLDAIDEALRIGQVAGRTQLSHLKATTPRNWGKMPAALSRIHRAREHGHDVAQDVYPYTASSTTLTSVLPADYLGGSGEHILAKLSAPTAHADLTAAIGRTTHFDRILIATTSSHRDEGRTLAEIADARSCDPVRALIDLLVDEELRVAMIHFSMHEDDLELALRDPRTMIGSDGLPPGNGGRPHPRMTGTFPRVLGRYVREREVLQLPDAVRRMTALPADTFRIPDRGMVAPGRIADLVAFDPATVADVGDYQEPMRPPAGIPWVCLGGRTVVEAGRFLGERAGTRLSPKA
ncbi:N-acyl-D-amino-acid deacylase family protein [Saccharopolyspora dendranthemae]|uniref:N-acyl-D-amino-acid deacylase n=1 Tax=Saccharopolyspora dendranthemae TaxID=1181886 RepID=A0A561U9D0_9PSEU|nr:D-aminoacylase [Saccharopolyspora dendranthemae]TWF95966.1 N-acyl-D-amino-acid deacylase [Saccharopolyspora dendranthemae]